MSESPKMVNLGCGYRYHRDWLNYDLMPSGPGVTKANFVTGVPLPDKSASAVYHSHILEHLPLRVGEMFLRECKRILAPGGILRIVVPDFEASARDYLEVIDRRRKGEELTLEHRWMLIELFDQMVRTNRGGMMGQTTRRARWNAKLLDFIAPRLGAEGRWLRERAKESTGPEEAPPDGKFEKLQKFLASFGNAGRSFAETVFRQRGEIHQWMYDELFLGDVLREVGFVEVHRMTHDTSGIPDFKRFGLDEEPDGTPYKGISLYMEAQRPMESPK